MGYHGSQCPFIGNSRCRREECKFFYPSNIENEEGSCVFQKIEAHLAVIAQKMTSE